MLLDLIALGVFIYILVILTQIRNELRKRS